MDSVECHSGFTYAEKPVALTWDGQRLEIDEILAAWRTPGERCFRVRTRGLRVFDLVYREAENDWQIQPVQEK
ncbi:MAG: hypothetical protein FD146_264 [Anaerolineaceae bacterium]|nr:MAG: hypothetical protein FD146_264 [Anaerolineaceae bacterium]